VSWYDVISSPKVSEVEQVTEDENILVVMSTTMIYDQVG
jgi:hypothetical protein